MDRRDSAAGQSPSGAMLSLYGALYAGLSPFFVPLVALHPRLKGGFRQRIGLDLPAAEGAVWLHGASAGDVMALAPLAHRLVADGYPVLISAWTRSGYQMAASRLGAEATIARAPLDLARPVRAVLDRVRPRLLVLECLELWPRLVTECRRRDIPVALVDGRISPTSLRLYRGARPLFRPCFSWLSYLAALTACDAERFIAAGVSPRRVEVRPSCKYAALAPRSSTPTLPKVVMGSVHRGEERILLPAVARLVAARPGTEVVIAPRYPHRARRIQRKLCRTGVASRLDSTEAAAGEAPTRVRILDSVGKLAAEYRGARVAFIGGSLVPHGGHNVVEAAAAGCPVLLGPHDDHCREEVTALVEEGGAAVIAGGEDFYRRATDLLDSAGLFAASQAACLRAAERLAQASRQTVDRVLAMVARP